MFDLYRIILTGTTQVSFLRVTMKQTQVSDLPGPVCWRFYSRRNQTHWGELWRASDSAEIPALLVVGSAERDRHHRRLERFSQPDGCIPTRKNIKTSTHKHTQSSCLYFLLFSCYYLKKEIVMFRNIKSTELHPLQNRSSPWGHQEGRTGQSNQHVVCPDLAPPRLYTIKWTPWNCRTGKKSAFSWSAFVSPVYKTSTS